MFGQTVIGSGMTTQPDLDIEAVSLRSALLIRRALQEASVATSQ